MTNMFTNILPGKISGRLFSFIKFWSNASLSAADHMPRAPSPLPWEVT